MMRFKSRTMPSLCKTEERKQVLCRLLMHVSAYCRETQTGQPNAAVCAGDFIVDDDGMGYADIGEEEDWGRADGKTENDADAQATSKRRKDGSTAGAEAVQLCLSCFTQSAVRGVTCGNLIHVHADQRGSKRKSAEPDPKARQRMQGMFKRAPVRAPQRNAATDQSSEDLLSDILGSIGGDAGYGP